MQIIVLVQRLSILKLNWILFELNFSERLNAQEKKFTI